MKQRMQSEMFQSKKYFKPKEDYSFPLKEVKRLSVKFQITNLASVELWSESRTSENMIPIKSEQAGYL